jgi:uncharacterized surface protein with fasciclin (FAS1) repeats
MNTRALRRASIAAVAAIGVLVLAACGDSSPTTSSSSPSPSPSAAITPSVVPSPAPGSAADAVKAGDLDQFVKIVTAAGLEKQLTEKGPWTIFAPNDEAFKAIPLTQLLADVKQLKSVVAYHVVPDANIQLDEVQDGQSFVTAEGSPVVITFDGATRLVNDAAIVGGYAGSNWTIYVIDQVLSPPVASPSASPSP